MLHCMLPGATNLPTGILFGSSDNDGINGNSVYVYSLHCGRSVHWRCNNAFTNTSIPVPPLQEAESYLYWWLWWSHCYHCCGCQEMQVYAKFLLLHYFTVKMSFLFLTANSNGKLFRSTWVERFEMTTNNTMSQLIIDKENSCAALIQPVQDNVRPCIGEYNTLMMVFNYY